LFDCARDHDGCSLREIYGGVRAMAVANGSDGYVHKLRLEAREGAYVSIAPALPAIESKYAAAWIVAKFVSLSIAFSSLLMLAAREIRG
jgi:hypothetical protein